jgi:hypothetical protein
LTPWEQFETEKKEEGRKKGRKKERKNERTHLTLTALLMEGLGSACLRISSISANMSTDLNFTNSG